MASRDRERKVVATVLDRPELVDRLIDGPKQKRELTDELPVSRSTVNRAIRNLETLDLVERTDEGYRATELCRTTATRLSALVESVAHRAKVQEFRRWVPEGVVDVDLSEADGRVYLAEEGNPYRMINRHVSRIRSSSTCRAVLPYVGLHAVETARDAIVEEGTTAVAVFCGGAVETVRTDPEFRAPVREMVDTGRFRAYVTDHAPSISASDFEGTVQLIADADEQPRALFESEDERVVRWVEKWIDGWIGRAEPFLPTDADGRTDPVAGGSPDGDGERPRVSGRRADPSDGRHGPGSG